MRAASNKYLVHWLLHITRMMFKGCGMGTLNAPIQTDNDLNF